MNDTPSPFLEGWISGRKLLIQKLRSLSADEIFDQLDLEEHKDRRTAANLRLRVRQSH